MIFHNVITDTDISLIVCKVPLNAYNFYIYTDDLDVKKLRWKLFLHNPEDVFFQELPLENYDSTKKQKLIGTFFGLKSEECTKYVTLLYEEYEAFHDKYYCFYKDYCDDERSYSSPKDSFESFLRTSIAADDFLKNEDEFDCPYQYLIIEEH